MLLECWKRDMKREKREGVRFETLRVSTLPTFQHTPRNAHFMRVYAMLKKANNVGCWLLPYLSDG